MNTPNRTFSLIAAAAVLLAAACAGPGAQRDGGGAGDPGSGGVRGRLIFEGAPLQDAYVYAYRNYGTNLLGPSDFASNPSGADGAYSVEMVQGTYNIVARKRASGENSGPITVGDLYTVNPNNPVTVRKGRYATVDLELVKMRDPMFFKAISRQETATGIKGVILDADGRPMPWVFAMVYTTADMKRVPEHTSVLTDIDGEFVIYLPRGGTYWLAARKNIRDKPIDGEPYGLYRGTPDYSIQVPDRSFVEGVTMRMEKYRKGIQD